jgi:hypothetical protein
VSRLCLYTTPIRMFSVLLSVSSRRLAKSPVSWDARCDYFRNITVIPA